MLMVGEEVNDRQLNPPGNHMLVLGAEKEMSPFASDPQKLIDQINRAGGLSFLAHPIEDSLERFKEQSYPWHNWDIDQYTGIELWNQMSEFKSVR
jgi:predicted metal-dependent phosphoesterase TrpH